MLACHARHSIAPVHMRLHHQLVTNKAPSIIDAESSQTNGTPYTDMVNKVQ